MHVVLFTSDDQTYAIPTSCVVEVVPAVEWRPLAHAEAWVKGVINYRATLLPLLDFALLLKQVPRPLQRSARILVVRTGKGVGSLLPERPAGGSPQETPDPFSQPARVGLLVERLLGSESLDFGDRTPQDSTGFQATGFLGPVALTRLGTIQLIDVAGLPLPHDL